jgi:hypothetical protein
VAEVRLVDLDVIKRYSLAVRRDTVPAEELLMALEASVETVRAAIAPEATATRRPRMVAAARPRPPATTPATAAATTKTPTATTKTPTATTKTPTATTKTPTATTKTPAAKRAPRKASGTRGDE